MPNPLLCILSLTDSLKPTTSHHVRRGLYSRWVYHATYVHEMLQMLEAVVAKLSGAQSTLLISSLLLIIARLVHLHLPELVQCLAALPGTDGEMSRAQLLDYCVPCPCWPQRTP